MNNVVLIGRLVIDPDLRFIPATGKAVATFRIAVDKGFSKEKKEELKKQGKQTADFIQIVVYNKKAENCAKYLAKGKMCAVQGRINTRTYTPENGDKKYITEVVANNVEFIDYGNKQSQGNQNNNHPDGDNDIFQPIDDEEVPF